MNEPALPADADADALLLTFLGGRDVACPSCGYNLRDLREPRCPECGDALTLGVRGGDRRIGGAVAGLIPLSGVACFDVGMSIFFVYMLLTQPYAMGRNDWSIFWLGFLIPGVVATTLLVLWLRSWRRMTRAPRGAQFILAGIAWLLPGVQIAVLNAVAG